MLDIWSWLKWLSLSNIGSAASLVSLVLTVWVALAIRRLRASYLFSARAPELAKHLRVHASHLANYLNDFDSFTDKIHAELAAAEVTAYSLARKMDWRNRRRVKQLGKAIKHVGHNELSEANLRVIYLQMIKVNEHVKDLQADLKWER
jgi:hypothetical protein